MKAPSLSLLAAAALLPAMVGPLPARAEAHYITICSGGALTQVPVDSGPAIPAGPNVPCCAKGCHGGDKRKRLDRRQ